MAICQNAPESEVAAAMRSTASRPLRVGSSLRTTWTIAPTSGVGHEFESAHRLDRDVPFEIERGLGEEIAEGAPGRERPGEHGRHRGGSWFCERPELGARVRPTTLAKPPPSNAERSPRAS